MENATNDTNVRIAYILKMYPRFSETFIVNELLAHEASGFPIDIYSLRPPVDGRFHDSLSKVTASVSYIRPKFNAELLWQEIHATGKMYPNLYTVMPEFARYSVRDVFQALLVSQRLYQSGTTHVHAHFANAAAVVASLVSKITSIPYTMTTHAKDIFHDSVVHSELERLIGSSKRTIAISKFNHKFLCNKFTALHDKISVIYNGLNLSHFNYQLPDSRPHHILAVGRLVEKKGFSVLIEACELLQQQNISFRCSIAGAGEYFDELQRMINEKSLQRMVQLLGPQPQWKIIQLMRESKVFAAPCVVGKDGNRDGLPTVLLEAMALGTPCVATDVTAIPELIQDGESGFVVPANDARALSDRLALLLGDTELCCRVASRARQVIEKNFDIMQNAGKLGRLFMHDADVLSESQQLAGAL